MALDVHDHRAVRRERLVERALQVARLVHRQAHRTHRLGDGGEVGIRKQPLLVGRRRLARVALDAILFLVQRVIVVHQDDDVQFLFDCRLDLGDVVPDAAVAGEAKHRPAGGRALGAQRRRQPPAQRARTADVALGGVLQVQHGAGPHTRVAGVGYQDRVGRQVLAQLAADALGPRRRDVRAPMLLDALLPVLNELPHLGPPSAVVGARLRRVDHRRQRRLGVPLQPHLHRVVAADLGRIDVELDDRRALRRNAEVVRHLPAGVAADEEHQVGPAEDAVGALARVVARRPHRQWVVGREHRLGVERRGHRNRQLLGYRDQLIACARGRHTAAGNDHRSAGAVQKVQRLGNRSRVGHRPERRNPGELALHDHLGIKLAVGDRHPADLLHVEVGGPRGAAHRTAERLAQVRRQRLRGVHVGAVLGNGRERLDVIHLLVGVALQVELALAAGQRYDRRTGQARVLQTGGEVGGPDRLGHHQRRAAADARVGIGHVGGRLLAVRLDGGDAQLAHLEDGGGHDVGHVEDVSEAVSVDGLGDEAGAGQPGHCSVIGPAAGWPVKFAPSLPAATCVRGPLELPLGDG